MEGSDSSISALSAAYAILRRLSPSQKPLPPVSPMYPYVVGGGRPEWDDALRFAPMRLLDGIDPAAAGKSHCGHDLVLSLRLAEFVEEYSHPRFHQAFDAVVTAFFLDATEDVTQTLRTIRHLLRPGGRWMNTGPLQWHPHAKVTLDYSDLVALLQAAGFDILHQQVPPAPKRLLASFLCTSSPLAPTLHALVSLFIRPVYASPCPDSPA